jgi:hypothetical protein
MIRMKDSEEEEIKRSVPGYSESKSITAETAEKAQRTQRVAI